MTGLFGSSSVGGLHRHSKIRKVTATLAVMALGALLVGCGDDASDGAAGEGTAEGTAAPSSSGEPLVLGNLSAFTGPLGVYGPEAEKVVQLAIDDINEAGGVFGHPVEFARGDSASEPAQGVAEAQRLVEVEGVDAFIDGGVGSGVNLAIKESVTGPSQIVHMCPFCASPALTDGQTDKQGFFFRVRADVAALAETLAGLAASHDVEKVCVVYVNNTVGQTGNEAFTDLFNRLVPDGSIQSEATPDASVASRLAETTRCTANGHTNLVMITYGIGQADQVMKEAVENRLAERFYFIEDQELPELFEELDWDTFDGSLGASGGSLPGEALDGFISRYEDAYGGPPTQPLTELLYDPVAILAFAAAHAGSTDGPALRDAVFEVSNAPGEKIGAGPDELARAFELIAAGEDIDYDGVSGVEFVDSGERGAGAVRVWAVDGPSKSIIQLGTSTFDSSTDGATFEPAERCARCDELLAGYGS